MSAETVEAQAPAERSGRRRWPWLLVLLVVLLAGAGGAWWWFQDDGQEADDVADGEVLDLEPLTTTTGEKGADHVRIALSIVLADGVDPEEVEPRVSLLRDELLRHIAATDSDQVRSERGSEQLREALTRDAHEIWDDQTVRRVLLNELLVQ
ncbi:MAG: flagellar basal body-associated FliL family protein [Actinomycetota bacterium]